MKISNRQTRVKRSAFTLIELLVAFGILAITSFLVYEFLIRGTQAANSGIWRNTTQKQLLVASDRLRKALTKASKPSVLLPEFNIVDKREEHFVVLSKGVEGPLSLGRGTDSGKADTKADGLFQSLGPGPIEGSAGEGGDPIFLLSATNCVPGHRRMQGLPNPDKAGVYNRFRLWLTNRRKVPQGKDYKEVMDLMYSEETGEYGENADPSNGTELSIPGDPAAIAGKAKLLVNAVNLVQIRLLNLDQDSVTDSVTQENKPTVEIGIRCVEPQSGKGTLAKFISAPMSVGVRYIN